MGAKEGVHRHKTVAIPMVAPAGTPRNLRNSSRSSMFLRQTSARIWLKSTAATADNIVGVVAVGSHIWHDRRTGGPGNEVEGQALNR